MHQAQPNWEQARRAMLLDPTVINLNTGSFGPSPRVVFEQVTELRRQLAAEPMDFLLRKQPPLLWTARARLAAFLGADPRELVFTANVSASINLVANSLQLASPGEILLSDHEYGAMQWCLERLAQRQGLSLKFFKLPHEPCTPEEIVTAACQQMTSRTRLLFFSHVLSPTGMVLPARALCTEAKRRGILTLVDGAHAPAMLPVQLHELGCDFYGGNCHKWLLAPIGSGFLYFTPAVADRLLPLQVSWGYHPERKRPFDQAELDERDEHGSTPRIRRLEFEGTRDLCAWLAVPSALDFQTELGWDAVRRRIQVLADYVRAQCATLPKLTLITPTHPELRGALTAYRLPFAVPDAPRLRRFFWERHRIEVPIVERPEALLVRVSTHFYNTEAEIERFVVALKELLEN